MQLVKMLFLFLKKYNFEINKAGLHLKQKIVVFVQDSRDLHCYTIDSLKCAILKSTNA